MKPTENTSGYAIPLGILKGESEKLSNGEGYSPFSRWYKPPVFAECDYVRTLSHPQLVIAHTLDELHQFNLGITIMKSTDKIHAIDFQALAKLTKDNKAAGIIMLLAIQASEEGQVALTNKAIIEATRMDRKNVSVALRHLRDKKCLLQDPVSDKVYHINSCLLRIRGNSSFNDAYYAPEFSAKLERLNYIPTPSREDVREVSRMNKVSDEQIAERI